MGVTHTLANLLAKLSRVAKREGKSNGGKKLTNALGNMGRVSEQAQKQALKSAERCGGELVGEGEREIGGGVGVGMWGRLVLVACVSVMNRTL